MTALRGRAGSRRSKDLRRARRIDALPHELEVRRGQAVVGVRCAHYEQEVGLPWGLRESSETEGRGFVRRREVPPEACDVAP